MKNAIRFGFVTLVLTGILAASVTPQSSAIVNADGSSPIPLCSPSDPKCKPPIPPQ